MKRTLIRSFLLIPLALLACNAMPQQGKPSEEILTGPPKSAELILRQPDEGFYPLSCDTGHNIGLLWELYGSPSGKFIHYFTIANKTKIEIEVRWLMLDRKR